VSKKKNAEATEDPSSAKPDSETLEARELSAPPEKASRKPAKPKPNKTSFKKGNPIGSETRFTKTRGRNPGGRRKLPDDLKEQLHLGARDAVAYLLSVVRGEEDAHARERIAASKIILDKIAPNAIPADSAAATGALNDLVTWLKAPVPDAPVSEAPASAAPSSEAPIPEATVLPVQ
jgi:hypothetical protein